MLSAEILAKGIFVNNTEIKEVSMQTTQPLFLMELENLYLPLMIHLKSLAVCLVSDSTTLRPKPYGYLDQWQEGIKNSFPREMLDGLKITSKCLVFGSLLITISC